METANKVYKRKSKKKINWGRFVIFAGIVAYIIMFVYTFFAQRIDGKINITYGEVEKKEVYTIEVVKKEESKEKKVEDKQVIETKKTSAIGTTTTTTGGTKEKKEFQKPYKKKIPDDPDIFYGRAFEGDVTPLCEVQDEIGEVVVYGKVLSNEETAMRNGEKLIVKFNFTDLTDTISGKLFLKPEEWAEIKGNFSFYLCSCYRGCFPDEDNIISRDPRFRKCETLLARVE